MSDRPNYAGGAVRFESALLSTANTNVDGSGQIEDVLIAGSSGTRVETVGFRCRATTALAGEIRWFVYDGAWRLLDVDWAVMAVAATTVALGTPPAGRYERTRLGDVNPLLQLAAGQKLGAATYRADSIIAFAAGNDY